MIALDPSAGAPHDQLGLFLGKELGTDNAITEFRRAISLDPGNAVTHIRLGLALGKGEKTDEEIAELRQAIELAPRLMTAHLSLAVTIGRLGQPDEAITDFIFHTETDVISDVNKIHRFGFTERTGGRTFYLDSG